MAAKLANLLIEQGKTFTRVIRWEATPILYKPITAIGQVAPVLITAAAHGVPDGWRVAIINVNGMLDLNSRNNPPRDSDFHPATFISASQIALNDISAAGFDAYTSGGYVMFYTPISLTGFIARMEIKDRVGGTILSSLVVAGAGSTGIALDTSLFTITLTITATDTALFTFGKAVYDLELVSSTGVVTAILTGAISLAREVTT